MLLLSDRIDEWMISHVREFDGKGIVDANRGNLDLGQLDSDEDKAVQEEVAKASGGLVGRNKAALDERVSDVRVSHRLTDSSVMLAAGEHDVGAQMRQILEATGQSVPESKPIFEINPGHPLIERLDKETDDERFGALSRILLEQVALAAGHDLNDPAGYVGRLNKLLIEPAG